MYKLTSSTQVVINVTLDLEFTKVLADALTAYTQSPDYKWSHELEKFLTSLKGNL